MIVVVAALIQRDGKLLICQRRADDRLPLKWEFPGGKVAPNESLQQALVRELAEELAVSACIGHEVHRTTFDYGDDRGLFELVFFTGEIARAEPQNLAFEQIQWVLPQQLAEFDFLPADRELIELIAAGKLQL
jgi:8-oxo-dGTP diphosphatase